jgi:hypothetical protein
MSKRMSDAYRGVPRLESLEARLLLDAGQVVISEIMYHPGFGDIGQPGYIPENLAEEYVELFNCGTDPVNLNGWQFTQGVDFTLPNVSIPGQGYLVVAADTAAFLAKYPTVDPAKVVGGWTGQLSNNGEDIELEDAAGTRVDFVSYSNEGDWAARRRDTGYGWNGWHWETLADAGKRSLELINPAASNECGQNWTAGTTDWGTPGAPNTVAAANIAPLILDVTQFPYVPKSTDPVTITARIVDELPSSTTTVTLYWRLDGEPAFTAEPMVDDGQHGDGQAGDGVFGGTIGAQENNKIVEFYVKATDSSGASRTWPAPSDDAGAQGANALYQVDDYVFPGPQPSYHLVIPAAELAGWTTYMQSSAGADTDVAMNGTFIAEGDGVTDLVYQAAIRNRGFGSRHKTPRNMHVNLPNDRPSHGLSAISFNTQFPDSQLAGSVMFLLAGLPAEDGAAVHMRVNNETNADTTASDGAKQYGMYFRMVTYSSEWLDKFYPEDPGGNLYKCAQGGSSLPDLQYVTDIGGNPDIAKYRVNYLKNSNISADDWTDIFNLTRILDTTPDALYTEAVQTVVNVDEWMRYFAMNALIGNRENALAAVGNSHAWKADDYSLYRSSCTTSKRAWAMETKTSMSRLM